ncbi:MAG: GAF domain-containing protein [Ilumatobacteraceae bacterium]
MSSDDLFSRLLTEPPDTAVTDLRIGDRLTELSNACCEVLGATAVCVLLLGRNGQLDVVAWSDAADAHLELFEQQRRQGPCSDCHSTNRPVRCDDLTTESAGERWPLFASAAITAGFQGAAAIPLRRGDRMLGVLGVLRDDPTPLTGDAMVAAQALADAATVAMLSNDSPSASIEQQLSQALHDRVLIEQAIGFISERDAVSIETATEQIRERARTDHHRLADVAAATIDGTVLSARRSVAGTPRLHVELPCSLQAPGIARRAFESWLTLQGASPRLSGDAQLIVSELVTNAVRHGRSSSTLTASSGGGVLRIEVHDQAPTLAAITPSVDGSSGHGLAIVQRLSHSWGCVAHDSGKMVWSEIHSLSRRRTSAADRARPDTGERQPR